MHPALQNEMKKRWDAVKSNHTNLHIGEYEEGDWTQGRTAGDPVNCWIWDGSDLQEVGPDTRHDRKVKAGGIFEQAGMRYVFDPENAGQVLVEFVTGALKGSGIFMKLSGDEQSLSAIPDGEKWSF